MRAHLCRFLRNGVRVQVLVTELKEFYHFGFPRSGAEFHVIFLIEMAFNITIYYIYLENNQSLYIKRLLNLYFFIIFVKFQID